MLSFLFPKPPPRREAVLTAIPIRNPEIRVARPGPGQLRLTAPLRQNALKRFFGTARTEKSFDLDELGAQVWDACDGKANLEKIITDFAAARRVNLREAEVAVSSFLRLLVQRNLLALAGTADPRPPKKARKPLRNKRRRK